VNVSASRGDGRIVVSVVDDGVGFDAAAVSGGFGLRNSRERLATFFDGDASLEIARRSPAGTVAAISMPAIARPVAARA
jgi:two-component system sensor histidine kinase YesM